MIQLKADEAKSAVRMTKELQNSTLYLFTVPCAGSKAKYQQVMMYLGLVQ